MKAERILLVFADAAARETARGQLLAAGYLWVEQARDAAHAIALARAHPPALALLDYRLADASGNALLQRFRADPLLTDVFVVLQRPPADATGAGPLQPDAHVHSFQLQAGLDDLVAGWLRQRRTTTMLQELLSRQQPPPLQTDHAVILEQVALGAPLPEVLARLARVVEAQCPYALCSILQAADDGTCLRLRAAPSLPGAFTQVLDGTAISPDTNCCGMAAYERRTIVATDIANGPRWRDGRPAELDHGLRACAALPLFDSDGQVLGILAIHLRSPGHPDARVMDLLESCAHVASIAMTRQRVEDRQRAGASLLQTAQAIADLGYWEYDLPTNRMEWSADACRLFGVTAGAFDGVTREFLEYVHPDDRERVRQATDGMVEIRQAVELEYRICRPDGAECVLFSRCDVVRADDGTALRVAGVVMDVTAARRTAFALNESEQRYQSLFSQNPDAVYSLDLDGNFLSVNPVFSRLTGYSEDEIRALGGRQLVAESSTTLIGAQFIRATRGEAVSYEVECLARDGRRFQALITNVPIVVDGQITGVYGIAKDITQRKHAEDRLRATQERMRLASQMARLGSWEIDVQGDRVSWSEEVCAIFGLPPGTMPRRGDGLRHYAPEYRARAHALFDACARDGTPFDEELQIIAAQERRVWVRSIGQAVRDESGAVVRVQGVLQDISERKQADAEMLHLEKQLTATLESMTDGFVMLDHVGHFIYLNAEAERVLQTRHGRVIGKLIWHEFELVAGSNFEHQFHVVLAEQRTVAFEEFYAPLGIWLDLRFYPTSDGVAIYFRDVSERKLAARQLTRSHRALDMLNGCNEALIRVKDERELLDQICRIVVERGDYKGAWVGFAHHDATRSISCEALAGDEAFAGYVAGLQLSWDETSATGRGPAGHTIRSGMLTSVEDVAEHPGFAPWQATALACGYSSGVCLPLRHDGHTFGLVAIYAERKQAMASEETGLLQKLADDLAFGIHYLRAQVEQQRIQAAVAKVASGVTARRGDDFFQHLALCMAEALGAQAGFIARLLPGDPPTARTIAVATGGHAADNFEYTLHGRPCMRMIEADECVIVNTSAAEFPDLGISLGFDVQAYVGRRLDNLAGEPIGLLVVLYRAPIRDSAFITSTLQIFAARACAELEREATDARIRAQASLLDKAQDAIIVRRLDDGVEYWNKSAERLYGWTADEVAHCPLPTLLFDEETKAAYDAAVEHTRQHGEWHGELVQRHKNGSKLIVEGRWTLVNDAAGRPFSILAINTDITSRKAAEHKIQHLAFYDPLTGLPNRQLLLDRLHQALSSHTRSGNHGALLFIDLDNFKALNDTLGHAKGDQLLIEVAHRLCSLIRDNDTVARLGGDEFVVMLEGLSDNLAKAAVQTKSIAETLLAALSLSYELDNLSHHGSASIGVTLFKDASQGTDELLKRADMAMYQAKAAGRDTVCFFDPEMQATVNARAALEADLREGLQLQQFELFYQAQVDQSGQPTGAEALLRWNHPRRGMVFPDAFIPLAEETRLILPLGQWVLETACNQLTLWSKVPATAGLEMSVNVSARQFHHRDFVQQVIDTLVRSGANPARLKLELTESLLLIDAEDVIEKMTALKNYGVGFSLDDFGTGYSSLSYLKRLPLDQLKIDRSFVNDVLTDPNDAVIVRTIVALGQSLGLSVLAEGVETEGQRDFLTRHDCRAHQGYLFSRPIPIHQFDDWFRQQLEAA